MFLKQFTFSIFILFNLLNAYANDEHAIQETKKVELAGDAGGATGSGGGGPKKQILMDTLVPLVFPSLNIQSYPEVDSSQIRNISVGVERRFVVGVESQYQYVDSSDLNKVLIPGIQWKKDMLLIQVTPESSGQIFFDNGEQLDFDILKSFLKK